MEKPKVRMVEPIPFMNEGREMILLRDAEGITEESLVVSKEVAFIISLMDGTRSIRDIQADCVRIFGEIIYLETIQEIVDAMDSHIFLLNDNFYRRFAEIRESYEKSPVREPFLAGKSYPSNRMDLLAYLDELLRDDVPVAEIKNITGVLSPHIDYTRGRETYRATYRCLKNASAPLIILLGTCHNYTGKIWNISLKDFSTPIKMIPSSKGLGELIRSNLFLRDYVDEWPHRREHSIELQLPLLQYFMKQEFEILPVLTGSMHEYIGGGREIDDGEITGIVENFREVLRAYGKPCIVLAGADLAHIGAQFGDAQPLNHFTLSESKEKDSILLERIKNLDARGFFDFIKGEGDARRICGLTPVFFQLKLLEGGTCEIVGYEQWTDGQSSVSFAGGIFTTR